MKIFIYLFILSFIYFAVIQIGSSTTHRLDLELLAQFSQIIISVVAELGFNLIV